MTLQNSVGRPPGGTPRKIGWGCTARFPKRLPYLWPKSAIPYPVYDQTKNSKPNLWPDPHTKILFQTCILIISSVVQTNFKLP